MVKHPPTMLELQEAWAGLLVQEDSLEEGMATHSSILGWKTPWTEEPGGLPSCGRKKLDMADVTACTHAWQLY